VSSNAGEATDACRATKSCEAIDAFRATDSCEAANSYEATDSSAQSPNSSTATVTAPIQSVATGSTYPSHTYATIDVHEAIQLSTSSTPAAVGGCDVIKPSLSTFNSFTDVADDDAIQLSVSAFNSCATTDDYNTIRLFVSTFNSFDG
jgi:hypothetical protein